MTTPETPQAAQEALLAVARAVDCSHQARLDSKAIVCAICRALEALDRAYPTWRRAALALALTGLLAGCVTVCQPIDPQAGSKARVSAALAGRPIPDEPETCQRMMVWPWTPAPGLAPYDPR